MLDLAFLLWRTAAFVGATPCGFTFGANQGSTTFGACAYKRDWPRVGTAFGRFYGRYLRDDFSAFFYPDEIALMQVQRADEVFVVKRGAFDYCTAQQNRFHVGNGCHCAGSAHLVTHGVEARQLFFGGELKRNSPTRSLGGIAQHLLLSQRVDFQYYTIGRHRQRLALFVPVVDIIHHLFHRVADANGVADVKTHVAGPFEPLIVCRTGQVLAQNIIQISVQSTLTDGFGIKQF